MKDFSGIEGLKAHIIFAQESQEEETFHQKDLVQLFPYGLSVNADVNRPFLLLRDEAHQYTLPVAVSPLEAGVSLALSNRAQAPTSPHKFTADLLESLGIEIRQAVFVEIRGQTQFMRLYLSGHPKVSSFKLKADEAMSLCLYLGVPLYATRNIIGRSRVLSTEVQAAERVQSVILGERGSGYLN